MVQKNDWPVVQGLCLGNRLGQGPVPIDEAIPLAPGQVEKMVAGPLGKSPVSVGHHHDRAAGLRDVGQSKAAEQSRRFDAGLGFGRPAGGDQAAHRLVVRALAQSLG